MKGSRERAAEYLLATHKKRNHPTTDNFMLLTDKGAIIPAMLHRWGVYLKRTRRAKDPVWEAWFRFSDLPAGEFAEQAKPIHAAVIQNASRFVNSRVAAAFLGELPKSMADVAKVYGKLLAAIESWSLLGFSCSKRPRLPPRFACSLRSRSQHRRRCYRCAAKGCPVRASSRPGARNCEFYDNEHSTERMRPGATS